MRKRCHRLVVLAVATMGVLAAAPPVAADHQWEARDCEDPSGGGGFERAQYEVVEDAGIVWLPVCRGWGPTWQGEIDYRTFDHTASARQDYEPTSGTLAWVGESERCCALVHVTIIDDELLEGEKRFEVRLTDYRGTFASRGRDSTIVRILDDDSRPSSGSSSAAQSSIRSDTGGATTRGEAPPGGASQEESKPIEVSTSDSASASTDLQPGPGFELIGSDLVSGPATSARLPEDKEGIAATVVLVLLAAVLVSGAWFWRRRSIW